MTRRVRSRSTRAPNGGVIGITFGEGFVNPKDADALRAAIEIETTAPLLTGRALDDYAAEDVRKLFGTRVKVASTVEDVADHIDPCDSEKSIGSADLLSQQQPNRSFEEAIET